MTQPIENREGNELAFLLFLGSWSPLGNLLSSPLMWPCPIEVLHIFANHPIELLFIQDQDVIEARLRVFAHCPRTVHRSHSPWVRGKVFSKL